MRRLKISTVALMALPVVAFTLGVSASPASAALELPTVEVLSGESFPVLAEGATKKQSEAVSLQTEAGSKLVAEELKVSLEIPSLGTSGTVALDFVGVTEGSSKGPKCETKGDSEGVVLLQSEFHFVPIGAKGELGIWLVVKEAVVTCSKEKVKVKLSGSWIAHVPQGSVGKGVESAGIVSHCKGAGKQELSKYWNDEEKAVEKQLLTANFGLGAENACAEVKEEIGIKFSKPISMKAWGKLVLNSASPWEMKQNQELTFLVAYSGVGTAAKISVAFTSGAFEERGGAPDPCQGKATLVKNETCEVKLKCIGAVGSQGQIEIKTPTWFVSNVEATMKCVA